MKRRIYLGLPDHLKSKVLCVGREYRTNILSHIPGGFDVVIEYVDENVFLYDWIKKPGNYISKILHGEDSTFVAGIEMEKGLFDDTLDMCRALFRKVYASYYENDNEYEKAVFKEVWNNSTYDKLPWDCILTPKEESKLKEYEQWIIEKKEKECLTSKKVREIQDILGNKKKMKQIERDLAESNIKYKLIAPYKHEIEAHIYGMYGMDYVIF